MLAFDPLLLNHPLSATSDADPDDVLAAKMSFNRLGYYEVPTYGMTQYPDQPLFDAIHEFQKAKGLTVDGYMLPEGETEQAVNFLLATTARDGKNVGDDNCADPAILPLPDIPGRRNYCPVPRSKDHDRDEEEPERRCWEQMQRDWRECQRLGPLPHISGEARRARCWASASDRYATCIRGFEPPPLDIGND